jgi:hypothetical protein
VHPEPVGADLAAAQELEDKARLPEHPQLLGEFTGRRDLVRLPDLRGPAHQPVVLPGETGDVLRPPMHENPPVRITADRRRDPMQPPLLDGLRPVHHPDDPVLLVHPLDQFTHAGHDRRGVRQRRAGC